MILDLLTSYFESFVAFWQGMGRMGLGQLLLIGLIIWFFAGPRKA